MILGFKKEYIGYSVLLIVAVVMLVVLLEMPSIEQDQAYHNFSDTMSISNISNFWNVISNLPFAIVGVLGLYKLKRIADGNILYMIFFLGLICVGVGSSYYHLNPGDNTLVWDRLPLTVVFMTLFSIIIKEYINAKVGVYLGLPLIILGFISICLWLFFNDLRLYVLVQFYPIIAIPIILVFFKSKYNFTQGYWLVLIAYALAKGLEYYDTEVHSFLQVISGHSLKHIVSAIGLFTLLHSYTKTKQVIKKTLL